MGGWVFAQRFDRIGTLGRKAVVSLAALDAKFVGAAETAEVLWAFGALIGNTDMHAGNLSWVSEHGRPYNIAPAYDMTPMAFAPSNSGKLPNTVPAMTLHASVRSQFSPLAPRPINSATACCGLIWPSIKATTAWAMGISTSKA